MSYVALYRKFRPDNFTDVKGQEHIVTTLKNQIIAGRLGHAYLFCGTRGTGKTTVAKLLAKTINCEDLKDGNPCGECRSCKAIAAGASMSVVEIDAASNNGVDNVREIINEVSFPPADAKYRVYIIDEVHMLSIGAFNALLKTLEEPPSYCVFILATTDPQKVPITILSRCQRYDFKRITVDTISDRLEELTTYENIEVEPRALRYIAKAADGSMRDALSLLDQCIAFHYGERLTYEAVLDVLGAVDTTVFSGLFRAIVDGEVIKCLNILEQSVMSGRDISQFVLDFTWYIRNIMVAKAAGEEELPDISDENRERLKEEADMCELPVIIRYIRIFSELSNSIRYASNKRVMVETAIIKLCKPQMENDLSSLVNRIKNLEEKLERGDFVSKNPGSIQGTVATTLGQAVTGEVTTPVKLPVALPEDIKQITENWGRLVNSASAMLKADLKGAYPSIEGEDKLKIVCNSKMSAAHLETDNNKVLLKNMLTECTGKEVSYLIDYIREDGSNLGLNPNLLTINNINIDIVTENSQEDEEYV